MSGLRDRLRDALRDNGIDESASIGMHSWRCAYPEQYGQCDCLDLLLDDLVRASETSEATP